MKKTIKVVYVQSMLVALALLSTPALAATTVWNDNDFSQDHLWTTTGNWNLGTPTFGVNARIDGLAAAGNVKPTLDAAGAADRLDLGFDFDGELDVVSGGVLSITNGPDGDAVVGWNTGSNGILNISGTGQVLANDDVRIGGHDNATDSTAVGIVNVSDNGILSGLGGIELGRFGNGTINVSGSANVTSGGDFFVGFQASASGTLTMGGGTVSSSSTFRIGDEGTGTLNMNGGVLTAGTLFMVGNKNGSDGTVTMTGGTIDSGGDVQVGIQTGANGSMDVSGGTIDAFGALRIGGQASGDLGIGTVTISAGAINTGVGNPTPRSVEVGRFGTGTLNLSGTGAVQATSDVFLGFQTGATGTVTMNGGSLGSTTTFRVGDSGTGTLNLNTGTATSGTQFMVGNKSGSTGTVTMTGGTIDSGGDVQVGIQTGANGSMNISGGTIDAFGALRIGGQDSGDSGIGTVTISAGAINTGVDNPTPRSVEVGRFGNGTLNVSGTAAIQASDQVLIGFQASATGTMTMDAGMVTSVSHFRVGDKGIGTLNMNGGSIDVGGQLIIGFDDLSSGEVNLGGGVIEAADLIMNDLAVLSLLDITGGTLILDNDQTTSVNTLIGGGLITAFGGLGTVLIDFNTINIGQTTLTATNTIPGDFNGSGGVNGLDLAVWEQNFGIGAGADADGDLDSDGNDFLIWQRNFVAGSPLSAVSAANVPEPATGFLLFMGTLTACLFGRRIHD